MHLLLTAIGAVQVSQMLKHKSQQMLKTWLKFCDLSGSETRQDQPWCECGRAEHFSGRTRMPSRQTLYAAVVESSPLMRWKMSVVPNVIC